MMHKSSSSSRMMWGIEVKQLFSGAMEEPMDHRRRVAPVTVWRSESHVWLFQACLDACAHLWLNFVLTGTPMPAGEVVGEVVAMAPILPPGC